MSDNDINDVNDSNRDGQECGSCGGGGGDADGSCCGSGNSHKQQDLKTLIFVLVLILAGAVVAHSIINKGKAKPGCGMGDSNCEFRQVEGGCGLKATEEGLAEEDAAAGGCPFGDETKVSEETPTGCCPAGGQAGESK